MLGKAMSVSFLSGPLNILTRLGRGTMRRGNEDCEQESDSQLVCGTCGGALFSVPTVRYPPVCLVDATRPRRARRGPEARAPRENSMCSRSSTGEHHRCGPEARAPRENSMCSRSSTGEHHRCRPEARAPRENSMYSNSSTGEHHRCGPEARAPGKTRCIQAALPENITDAGRRPAHPGKTRCIQAALPENITDAGRRPAHPGRPRGRKMVTGEPDRNLTSPNPPPIRRDSGQDSDCRL